SVLPCHGDPVGTCRVKTAPGTNRLSGSSVKSSSLMAPLSPWAFVSRPTRSWVFGILSVLTLGIGVDDVDAYAATIGEGRNQGAQCLCRTARAADHTAEVLGVHANLEDLTAW